VSNRFHVVLDPELNQRMLNYLLKKYGPFELHGKRSEILRNAITEFLDRHEKEVEK
jgi:metal-responsive CopG/Arc/MetJ family transcriptional regulator